MSERLIQPPSKDLERRRPVWAALSELFLDTELQTDDFQRIATVLWSSEYSEVELNEILRKEVAPVVRANLSSAAGTWEGFDQEWLEAEILRREPKRFSWPHLFNNYRLIEDDWAMVLREFRLLKS